MASVDPNEAPDGRRRRVVLVDLQLNEDLARRLPEMGAIEILCASAGSLDRVLPDADILICAGVDVDSVVHGCRAGLKPVQIGGAVANSDHFCHVFRDTEGFLRALPHLRGELSIAEYEAFCCSTLGGGGDNERAVGGGPGGEVRSVVAATWDAIANPLAAFRLLRAAVSEYRERSGWRARP